LKQKRAQKCKLAHPEQAQNASAEFCSHMVANLGGYDLEDETQKRWSKTLQQSISPKKIR